MINIEEKDYLDEIKDTDDLIAAVKDDNALLDAEKRAIMTDYDTKMAEILSYLSNPQLNGYYSQANPYENTEPPKEETYSSKWERIKSNFKKIIKGEQ